MLTALDLENKIRPYLPNFTHPEQNKKGLGEVWDEVKEYQLRKNIPATYLREVNWEGHIITAPFYSPFLHWNEHDLKYMKDDKDRVLKWFVNLVNDKVENDGYLLCQQTFDEDICEIYLPLDVKHFEKNAQEFDWIELFYSDDYVYSYFTDESETVKCWDKCFDVYLKKGDSLDMIQSLLTSQMFSLRKTFLSDPRK
jgi:hypothetical protein